ncbi:MAG TPA: protein translocase subunit SecDF [Flavobacteriales bacterium]|nr:protein translocase subunit SecDF [Flavobacteriales bacterium]
MQNKGLITTFTILLAIASLYSISFTFVANSVENKAKEYAQGDIQKEEAYLDSMRSVEVYPVFGFTYDYVKKHELNLGLDLKGGMNVVLEVSLADVIDALSNHSKDPDYRAALKLAKEKQRNSDKDFVTLFAEAWNEVAPNKKLVSVFYTLQNKDKISPDASNEEVLAFLREETSDAIERSFNVLRTRVNLFGVAQPNIQKLEGSDRILVELPGVKNKERVRQLLQGTAQLEFWTTRENADVYPLLEQANQKLALILNPDLNKEEKPDTAAVANDNAQDNENTNTVTADTDSLSNDSTETEEENLIEELSETKSDSAASKEEMSQEEFAKKNPLWAVLRPAIYQNENGQYYPGRGPVVGYAAITDTAKVNAYLRRKEIRALFPRLKFLWTAKPTDKEGRYLAIVAIDVKNKDGKAPLEGDVIVDAKQDFDQFSGNAQIDMVMNAKGAKVWKNLTKANIGKSIAIVLDNYVYSYPTVQGEIAGGRSQITGDFTIEEAKLIANILKAGKLPAPARIVEEAIVGPSLGQKSISDGLRSFMIALLIVLIYMAFYYGKAGIASDVALIANLFFLLGVLTSTNIALTLPGIAGIVLTIGMSVDANVLIFERIREELAAGKSLRLAITDGYRNAYSSIIDANVTTLLTGIILWMFGTGPVEGFAKTLVIGIFTSLFSAIFITRLIFEWQLSKKKAITFATKLTDGAFKNVNFQFIKNRKKFYIISGLIIAVGLGSLFTKGLNFGVDFTGGRTYLVKFEQPVEPTEVAADLADVFEGAPEVKTFGSSDQVKITTNYMIDSEAENADDEVESKLNEGLQKTGISYEILSSQKVGPTIADDIKTSAFWAILFSLIVIFVYIVIRFRKIPFGIGAIAALFHDVLIVIGLFSIFYGVLPFSLEIDQAFIAAILTVVGYSINDTMVVFDRIREYLGLHKKQKMDEVVNNALNSTLSRTINTSLSTIFVLLMIFLFGGEVIRGFAFALLVGVTVGTYSSLCIAAPVMYDLVSKNEEEATSSNKKKKK